MNKYDNQDHLNLLRQIKKKPSSSQRELAEELGFSLGKLNYCLKALKKKGFLKILKDFLSWAECKNLKLEVGT